MRIIDIQPTLPLNTTQGPCSRKRPTNLDSYADDELRALIEESSRLATTREEVVRMLYPTLVAKPTSPPFDPLDEVYAMNATRSAGVNVPKVRRVLRAE